MTQIRPLYTLAVSTHIYIDLIILLFKFYDQMVPQYIWNPTQPNEQKLYIFVLDVVIRNTVIFHNENINVLL